MLERIGIVPMSSRGAPVRDIIGDVTKLPVNDVKAVLIRNDNGVRAPLDTACASVSNK